MNKLPDFTNNVQKFLILNFILYTLILEVESNQILYIEAILSKTNAEDD